ncbi:cation transporter, partial [Escherichia coli]
MDCPSCAQKIENAVKQITEVKQAKVLFATEKLVVDADKDISASVRSTVEAAGYELL